MAVNNYQNAANTSYRSTGNQTVTVPPATVIYNAGDSYSVTVTKTVDHPNEYYYQGDPIVFTITITRTPGVTGTINNIVVNDTLEKPFKLATGDVNNDVLITNGAGAGISYNVATRLLTINNLVLNTGQGDVISITIHGVIDLNQP